jgi:hypothetical protein
MNRSIRIGLLAGAVLLPTVPLPAEPAATSQDKSVSPEAKPYVLFMRTDVAVEQNKKLYPIKDVSGKDFIVSADGQKVAVPMVGGSHRIEFQHALTLARTSASLTGLKSGRAYTPGADPVMLRQIKSVEVSAAIGDGASLAEGQALANANGGFTVGNIPPQGMTAAQASQINSAAQAALKDAIANGVTGLALAALNAAAGQAAANAINLGNVETATAAQHMDADRLASAVADSAFARLHAEEDLAQELFDAVEVSFEVSSPVYLEKPYLVLITRFHARDDKPGVARNAVYAKALNSIGSKPTRIDVLHGGFPPGFEIEDLQVHLYSDGHEIPTEIANKRVPLTRDEAFEYLRIEYVSGHKGDTVPATPALGRPDKEEQVKLSPNQWKADYYAKVSKDGRSLGTYLDEACTQPVDDLVAALAQNVRYYPAMEKGKPVEGIARLSWRQLAL